MKRRSFLKILTGAAAAVVAAPAIGQGMPRPALAQPAVSAPLYIPPQHLDYGVPRQIVTARSMSEVAPVADAYAEMQHPLGEIPMLLRQAEYLPGFGGKLPAGSTVMVDRVTADRWVANHVAVPAPSAPRELQDQSAKLLAERRAWQTTIQDQWASGYGEAVEDPIGTTMRMSGYVRARNESERAFQAMLKRAGEQAAKRQRAPIRWDDDELGGVEESG